jgi:hypothetical protein
MASSKCMKAAKRICQPVMKYQNRRENQQWRGIEIS